MQTPISLPGDFLNKTIALRKYIPTRQQEDLTERINAACINLDTSLPEDVARMTHQKLLETDW